MPQIDFGQAFSTPDKDAPSACRSAQPGQLESARSALMEHKPREFPSGARFGRPEWANVFFATVTFVGGLFCAFYFFNGAELLRAATAWPAELLYSRPAITASGELNHASDEAFLFSPSSAASADGGGDPFSRCAGLMSLILPSTIGSSGAGAGLPSTATAANAGSPLVQLGFPAPGGDALTQAFNRAVADLARVSNLEAHRTVAVIQTAVSKVKKRTSSRAEDTAQRSVSAATNGVGEQAASTSAGTAQNQTDANNATQQMMGSTRSTMSRAGSGLGSALGHAPVSLSGHH